MRRPSIDNVEIIEPPFEELNKKRSGFGKACLTSCLFIILFIVGAIIAFRIFAGPGPQVLSKVPDNFPKDILVYDPDGINSITYISGKYKNRSMEIAALFPKVILSPLFISLDKNNTSGQQPNNSNTSFQNLWKIITTPVGNSRNTVQIDWVNMDADAAFVVEHYKNELQKNNFTIDVESSGQGIEQFSFSRTTDRIDGSLYVQVASEGGNATYAVLTVNLPSTAPSK